MKQVFFQLKVVYNDDDYYGDNRPSAITKHVGQAGNEYAQPQPWMSFQWYDKINEIMKILYTHVMILCKLLIFGEDD